MSIVERPPSEPITFPEVLDSAVPIERAPMAGRFEADADRSTAIDAPLVSKVVDASERRPIVRSDSRSPEVHDVTAFGEARYH